MTNTGAVALLERFHDVRRWSETLCEPLEPEDMMVQSSPDCSPTKWHLAHTSWFFETFVLKAFKPDYVSPHPEYNFLFNSYYNAIGERHERFKRGVISRPTVAQTWAYRNFIDRTIEEFLQNAPLETVRVLEPVFTLGLNHEQQHQELMLTDIKHALSENPLRPLYIEQSSKQKAVEMPLRWTSFDEGIYEVGHEGNNFAFDNESPRHKVYLNNFALANRLTTNIEYSNFIADGGYRRAELWLAAGWNWIQENKITSPLYWQKEGADWQHFTLNGMQKWEDNAPLCHVSLYEADAFARWSQCRLPTEAEWEIASQSLKIEGHFAESKLFHPQGLGEESSTRIAQLFGDVWQWTRSQYEPYPGYAPVEGALGEYNGKFMCNQFVLRGASCATPQSHARATYRNFFPPDARWQFSGLRLAKDL